jgi:hypothetical protein
MPIPRRCGETLLSDRPASRISPRVAASNPTSINRHEVLPDPDGRQELALLHVEVQAFHDQRAAVVSLLHVDESHKRLTFSA